MPISQEFDYKKPATVEETVSLLSEYGRNAGILAGGTDMANMLKQGFPVPELMIDIKGIEALKQIRLEGNVLHIGSLVTFSDIISSDIIRQACFALFEAAGLVASKGIRNRATMAGNICTAVACMDSAAPLLVHDACIHLQSSAGERRLPVGKWFVDNRKTARQPDELLTCISMELPRQRYAGVYKKLMRYGGEDLAQANVGLLAIDDGSFRLAFGAVGPIPKRCLKIEHFLNGKKIDNSVLNRVGEMVPEVISPITDIRATKEYRSLMTAQMLKDAIELAIERLNASK